MGECSEDIDCSDDAKNHFAILEEGDALDVISDLPTADVVEIVHGEWKRVRWVKCDDPDGGYWIVRCNQCSIPHFKEYRFCPSCGAKMDGKKVTE